MARHTYQLAARMEGGEVSDLFRGTQDRNRAVAFKVFAPRLSDADYGKALVEASRRVGALGHPVILHYEEVGTAFERLCLVRADLDGYHLGTALSRLASKEVVLPAPVALQIGIEVMNAVGAAHQAGIVHGALTPANIWVTRDGRVFVTDFMALWAMRQSPVLKPLAERGRHAYRAPELSRGTEPDASADVYSVGAILYELLTLREVAASRGGGVSTRRDVLTPPSRLDRRVNARLDPIFVRALDNNKARRQKSCAEMADALREFLAGAGAVPGRTEIGRFVNELFPNEVSLSGSNAELPFTGEFSLEPVDTSRSLPGLKVDVSERISYSRPLGDSIPALASAPPELTPVEEKTENGPPAASAPEPKTEQPEAFSEWEAPPGQLDPAVIRKLSGSVVLPEDALPAAVPRDPTEVRRPAPHENFRGVDVLRTDVTTNPTSAREIFTGGPPASVEPPREAVRRPRAHRAPSPAPVPAKPKADWHAVYVPPPPPAKPRTPARLWFLAFAMAGGAALLTYLAVSHRTHATLPGPDLQAAAQTGSPARNTGRSTGHRSGEAPSGPAKFCVSVETDVQPATLTIDGSRAVALPVYNLPVAAGAHTLVVSGKGHVQSLTVDETATRVPCRTKVILFGPGPAAH